MARAPQLGKATDRRVRPFPSAREYFLLEPARHDGPTLPTAKTARPSSVGVINFVSDKVRSLSGTRENPRAGADTREPWERSGAL